jgi:hypothetical protein
MVSVRTHGAIGNGISDDTGAILKATRAAQAIGEDLVFPKGNYRIKTSIPIYSYMNIRGEGKQAIIQVPAGSTFPAFKLDGVDQVSISNLKFIKEGGNPLSGSANAIQMLGGCTDINITDVNTDGYVHGVHMEGNAGIYENATFTVKLSNSTSGIWALGITLPTAFAQPTWTTDLAFNATAATVQTALEVITGAGNVEVAGGPGNTTAYTITFKGTLAGLRFTPFITKNTLVGGGNNGVTIIPVSWGSGNWVKRVSLTNVVVLNSPASWGIHCDYVQDLTMVNCRSYFNWLDGVKLRRHVFNVQIIGGDFSYNGQGWFTDSITYAGDGFDSYAGGERYRISCASFNYNAGNGLQIKNDDGNTLSGYENNTKFGISRKIDINSIEASYNTFYGIVVTHNSGNTSYGISDTTISGGLMEYNGQSGIYLESLRTTLNGVKVRRNSVTGITVQTNAKFININNCTSVANGPNVSPATGVGLFIAGQQVTVMGGIYVGVDTENYRLNTDPTTLTKYHGTNINVGASASDVRIIFPYEAHHDATAGRAVQVNGSATRVQIWQRPTQTGLVPGSSLIFGSPGSLMVKDDAAIPNDYLWVKTNGGPASVGVWKRVGGPGVVTKTANYTTISSDDLILGNAGASDITMTLVTAVGNLGLVQEIKRINSTAGNVIVDPNGSETIEGVTTKTLGSQWAKLKLVSDNNNWIILDQMGTIT